MATVNMAEDGITGHLVGYSIPLILDNVFQLTYNTMDSVIAGRFIGKEALAAEDTADPIMSIVILGMSGICMRAFVLMSEFYGAGQKEKLKREMSTTVIFGCYFSMLIAILGGPFSKPLLGVLGVPGEMLGKAASYLSIILLGAPFAYFYNAVSAALKSVGDSRMSLRFLAFSSISNAVLGLIFIGGMGFDIIRSAVITVMVEAAPAFLCIAYIYGRIPMLQLRRGEFSMDGQLLGQTLRYGGITTLQQSYQPIGKLLIQGAVSPLGVGMTAAFNVINRIDDFVFTPEQSISHGIIAFVA